MKFQAYFIATALIVTASTGFAATSSQGDKVPCETPFSSVECLSTLQAPKGLPPTVKVEAVREYAQKLLILSQELPESLAALQKLQRVEFAAAGRPQLEKALKLATSILSDVEQAKLKIGTFADLQYYASRASLDAGRVGNALSELRLAVLPSPDAAKIFDYLQAQIETYDALGTELMPDWLN